MEKKSLGASDLKVSRMGLGRMWMTDFFEASDKARWIRVLHQASELGINFFDTSNIYSRGKNENLLGCAFKGRWKDAIVGTKVGIVRDSSGRDWGFNGRPEYVKTACEASLKQLGNESIDIYYLHRADPEVPIEETVGEMSDLVKEGKVRYLGLCEVSSDQLRRAHREHPITALQSEYSVWSREVEKEIIPTCRKLDVGFVPYWPLGRGFLTGAIASRKDLDANDNRLGAPRFQEEAMQANNKFVETLDKIAKKKEATPAQVALAWLLHQGKDIFPIPSSRQLDHIKENVNSIDVSLSAEELATINQRLPMGSTTGSRH
jgi:aryl-alcohol dehydrogenase-like predicted oxidoreductase